MGVSSSQNRVLGSFLINQGLSNDAGRTILRAIAENMKAWYNGTNPACHSTVELSTASAGSNGRRVAAAAASAGIITNDMVHLSVRHAVTIGGVTSHVLRTNMCILRRSGTATNAGEHYCSFWWDLDSGALGSVFVVNPIMGGFDGSSTFVCAMATRDWFTIATGSNANCTWGQFWNELGDPVKRLLDDLLVGMQYTGTV